MFRILQLHCSLQINSIWQIKRVEIVNITKAIYLISNHTKSWTHIIQLSVFFTARFDTIHSIIHIYNQQEKMKASFIKLSRFTL